MNPVLSPYRLTRLDGADRAALVQARTLADRIAAETGDRIDPQLLADPSSNRLAADGASSCVVAWREAEPCGLVAGTSADGRTFDLRAGGVLPGHCRHGLGMALLDEIEGAAFASGISAIRASVPCDRRSAMRLLLAFGMRIVGVLEDHPGHSIHVVFRKAVGEPPLRRTWSERDLNVKVDAWPIKRLCELESIYQASFGELLDDGHPTLDEMVMLDSTYENYLHVALVDGEPVGFKQAQERTRGVLHSHIGAVHPDARGAGVASKLMAAQHKFAKSNGFGGIATRSRNRYPQMIRLNLKHGFDIVGVVQALGEPAIHMFKRLK